MKVVQLGNGGLVLEPESDADAERIAELKAEFLGPSPNLDTGGGPPDKPQ